MSSVHRLDADDFVDRPMSWWFTEFSENTRKKFDEEKAAKVATSKISAIDPLAIDAAILAEIANATLKEMGYKI